MTEPTKAQIQAAQATRDAVKACGLHKTHKTIIDYLNYLTSDLLSLHEDLQMALVSYTMQYLKRNKLGPITEAEVATIVEQFIREGQRRQAIGERRYKV